MLEVAVVVKLKVKILKELKLFQYISMGFNEVQYFEYKFIIKHESLLCITKCSECF